MSAYLAPLGDFMALNERPLATHLRGYGSHWARPAARDCGRRTGLGRKDQGDPSRPLSLRAGNGSSCPKPAIAESQPRGLSREETGYSSVAPKSRISSHL